MDFGNRKMFIVAFIDHYDSLAHDVFGGYIKKYEKPEVVRTFGYLIAKFSHCDFNCFEVCRHAALPHCRGFLEAQVDARV